MTVVTEDNQLLGMFKNVERSQAERGWMDEDKQWAYQLSEISFIDQPPNEVTISYREKFGDQDYGTPILVEQKFFQTRDEAEDYISEMKHEKMEERRGGAGAMAPHREEREEARRPVARERWEERRAPERERYEEREERYAPERYAPERYEERRAPERMYEERRMPKVHTSGWGVASLVLGIIGIFLAVTFLPALLAIVFGIIGISSVKKDHEVTGKGLAVAGIILGAVGIIAGIAAVVYGVELLQAFLPAA